jgi:hypothetical protein
MQRDIGYAVRLQFVYYVVYAVMAVNLFVNASYGPVAGSVPWDERVDRLSFTFWWFWSMSYAITFSPWITLWLMHHTFNGIFYTIHLVVVSASLAGTALYGIMLFIDNVYTNCTEQLCDGTSLPPTKYGTRPDWALNSYTGIVGVNMIACCVYIVFNWYLRRRTEFRVQAEMVADSRAPPLSRAYMRQAANGGFNSFFDAMAMPGTHSLAFEPSTGQAMMGSAINNNEMPSTTTKPGDYQLIGTETA